MIAHSAGDRLEVAGAPVKADNGRWMIASVGKWDGAATVYQLYRINERDEVQDVPPIGASTSWYRRNHRSLTHELLEAHGRVFFRAPWTPRRPGPQ